MLAGFAHVFAAVWSIVDAADLGFHIAPNRQNLPIAGGTFCLSASP
jgi:hypothetical protein